MVVTQGKIKEVRFRGKFWLKCFAKYGNLTHI